MSRTERFDPSRGLIVVPTRVSGPLGSAVLHLALDTGANITLLRPGHLLALGYDSSASKQSIRLTTASGVETAPLVEIRRIEAIGIARSRFLVLAHDLPASASVDGLLGLDYMRRRRLTVDFKAGRISLT